MRNAALLSLALPLLASARVHHSRVPEDPHAFPKFRVSFLNGLPVLNDTAQRWLREGLRGGELEFLEQPWQESPWPPNPLKSIQSADDPAPEAAAAAAAAAVPSPSANYSLQQMKMGPKSTYLCLIPPPPQDPAPAVEETPVEVATPVHSWSLLQPLSGTCLYHRQGWFTYSYCHNSHVRQFHELHHSQVPSTGEYKPEEDPEWEAYTLGRAPATLEAGAELTTAEAAAAANLELARGAGSRYLVQRWSDGTFCDKMGRKREIEIQFHCSMTMTDTILFVKETQTCAYVLHIATPRLCGEPGFKSRVDAEEERAVRCREVVGPEAYERADRALPAAAHPFRLPHTLVRKDKKVIAPPPVAAAGAAAPAHDKGQKEQKEGAGGKDAAVGGGATDEALRAALKRLLLSRLQQEGGAGGHQHMQQEILIDELDGHEFVVDIIDLDAFEASEAHGDGHGDDGALYFDVDEADDLHERLLDTLRGAGFEVNAERKAYRLHGDRDSSDEDETEGRGRRERERAGRGREEL